MDRDIVRPLLELSEIQKKVAKTMLKRNHKLIDYDRHRIALQKITTKAERSFSEEKQVFKVKELLRKTSYVLTLFPADSTTIRYSNSRL